MDVDLDEENDMNLIMIDSILGKRRFFCCNINSILAFHLLELWQTKHLNTIIDQDFSDVKNKIKTRFELLIESIRNLETSYLNHVQVLESDFKM